MPRSTPTESPALEQVDRSAFDTSGGSASTHGPGDPGGLVSREQGGSADPLTPAVVPAGF